MDFSTTNPATGDLIDSYQTETQESVEQKITALKEAQTEWAQIPLEERCRLIAPLATALRDNLDRCAQAMTEEMGKPIKESRAEVEKCAWLVEVFSSEAPSWLKTEMLTADGHEHSVVFQPLGVILSIMPWNFPFWQVIRFAIPAIITGNTVLLKHSNQVPQCSLLIEELFNKTVDGRQLLQSTITDHHALNVAFAHPSIQGISFTGSTVVGKKIGEMAGAHLKKVVLELGGSDPFIVLKDAPYEEAVQGALLGRCLNSGQSCIAAKRFIVHEELYDQFVKDLTTGMDRKVVGDPQKEESEIGPLVNQQAVEELKELVADALEKGAKIHCGGTVGPGKGHYFLPTVITNITKEMRIYYEETFGPVASIYKVSSDKEAIEIANDTPFGLGGSVWSKDLTRARELCLQLECGTTFVNSIVKSDPRLPFGGVKESGIGRELSHYGIKEFVNIKGINLYSAT